MGLARLIAAGAALAIATAADARPTQSGSTAPRYDDGDVVEHHDPPGGDFRIHFTREGTHAVPSADTNASGVPDFVETVGAIYEEVAEVYHDVFGYRWPLSDEILLGDNGGDGRFDVYLIDFAHQADGAFRIDACLADVPEQCIGHVLQENDFAGYGYPSREFGARVLGSHEYFHAVQAAYNVTQGPVLGEGTAVWASDAFDPGLREVAAFARGYLDNPDRSLDVPLPGPVDRFSYGSAIFFQFLSERYDDEVIRLLWEHVVPGAGLATGGDDPDAPWWLHQLDAVLDVYYDSRFAEAFLDFVVWNLHTGARADPAVAYADGARYPQVAMEPWVLPSPGGERYRYYYAAARYFDVDPRGRDALHAALVDPEGDGAALEDLHLLAALRAGGTWTVSAASDPAAGLGPAAAGGAEQVVFLVVNTALDGASRRPWLCIGTAEEVAGCRAEHGAEDPDDCTVEPCDPMPHPPDDGGCACAVGGPASPVLPLLLLALAAAGRRRGAAAGCLRIHRGPSPRRA